IEVLEPDRGWSYVDSYLDILLHGTSAEELATSSIREGRIQALPIATSYAQLSLGKALTLRRLFKYRSYGDQLTRLPMVSALRLRTSAGEAAYGTTWTLNIATPRPAEELFPERQTIYVRARYVLDDRHTIRGPSDETVKLRPGDTTPVAS